MKEFFILPELHYIQRYSVLRQRKLLRHQRDTLEGADRHSETTSPAHGNMIDPQPMPPISISKAGGRISPKQTEATALKHATSSEKCLVTDPPSMAARQERKGLSLSSAHGFLIAKLLLPPSHTQSHHPLYRSQRRRWERVSERQASASAPLRGAISSTHQRISRRGRQEPSTKSAGQRGRPREKGQRSWRIRRRESMDTNRLQGLLGFAVRRERIYGNTERCVRERVCVWTKMGGN